MNAVAKDEIVKYADKFDKDFSNVILGIAEKKLN